MRKVFANLVGIGTRLIDFVDGKHHRHIGRLCVGDGLLRGGHHRVVGSDDDDGDVGHLRTACAHGREGFVARRVEEGDAPTVFQLHVVGTDVLRDAAGLARDDVGLADIVEQRGLTVIDVSHHRDDGRARDEVVFVVFHFADGLLHLGRDVFGLESELVGHKVDGFGVHTLVDRHHNADRHQRRNHLHRRDAHHRGEFADGHKLRQFQHLRLCHFGVLLLVQAFLYGFALLLAVFCALLVLTFRRQSGECLLHLASHVFLVHFEGTLVATAVFLFLAALLATLLGCGTCGLHLVLRRIDIDALLADAHALFALALLLALLGGLFFAFLALLFLRFFLRTSALVERIEVDFTLNLQLRRVLQLFVALELENGGSRLRFSLRLGWFFDGLLHFLLHWFHDGLFSGFFLLFLDRFFHFFLHRLLRLLFNRFLCWNLLYDRLLGLFFSQFFLRDGFFFLGRLFSLFVEIAEVDFAQWLEFLRRFFVRRQQVFGTAFGCGFAGRFFRFL